MERREQYDPEDIESLLTERSYDELLAEERAFVLRHLSGREEYEQMRALLHYVRPDEHSRPMIEPEARVRTNVLAAFRAQQQPQWRVWLNSIAAWLAPGDAAAFWRPALAFGSLALLIIAGVIAVRQFGNSDEAAQLAEVKPVSALEKEKASSEPSAVERGPTDPIVVSEDDAVQTTAEGTTRATRASSATDAAEPPPAMFDVDVAEAKYLEPAEEPTMDATNAAQGREELAAAMAKEEQADMVFVPATTGATATAPVPSLSHVVTQDELVRNQSTSNVSVGSKASQTRKRATTVEKTLDDAISASRSLGQDPALMGLINSGW